MRSLWAFIIGLFASFSVPHSHEVINIYNWAGYLPPTVIEKFTQETGIHVQYNTFPNNEVLYTKLKADPEAHYDVVFASTYLVNRMIQEQMIQPLKKSRFKNFKNLDPHLLNKSYDPHNRYSIPYLWGSTGIIINTKQYSPQEFSTWQKLWNPKLKHKIALIDDMRDVMGMGLKVLGYSINDRNPTHIQQAFLKLKELMPNVLLFASDGAQQMFVNEDAMIGVLGSGDAYLITKENPQYTYLYPKDGPLLWIDSMVIPTNAEHLDHAYQFINFILRPDIAKIIGEEMAFSIPNLQGKKLLSKEIRHNPIINPTTQNLKHGEFEEDIGIKTHRLYVHYWEMLKLGN